MKDIRFTHLSVLIIFWLSGTSFAIELEGLSCADISFADEYIDLAPYLFYQKASNGTPPEQIPALAWQFNSGKSANFGIGAGKYWFAICLQNNSLKTLDRLIEIPHAPLDYVTMYKLGPTGPVLLGQSGDRRPFISRSIPHRHHVFAMQLDAKTQSTYVFSAKSEGTLKFPVYLWDEKHFYAADLKPLVLQFLLAGIGLALVLYNLFLFFGTREPVYFSYVLSIAATNLYFLSVNGITAQFFWPTSPNLDSWVAIASVATLITASSVFTYQILRVGQLNLFIRTCYQLHIILGLLLLLSSPWASYDTIVRTEVILGISAPIMFILTGLYLSIKGNKIALIYTLAWVFFLSGSITLALNHLGILPNLLIFRLGQQVGGAIEGILLSFVLAYRMNIEKQNRIKAQDDLLRVKESINKELEQRVQERTRTLEQAQKDLTKTAQARQHAIEKEKQLVKEKEMLLNQKDAMLSVISHEMKTPLTVIRGALQQIDSKASNPIKQKNLKQLLMTNTERLHAFVQQILLTARLQKSPDTVLKEIPFSSLVHATVTNFFALSQLYDHTINTKIEENIAVVGSCGELEILVANLIKNAIYHSGQGSSIDVCLSLDRGQTILTICDDGRGMDEKTQEIAFDAFRSGGDSEQQLSSGLGLHLARNIVSFHNGSIEIESELNRGTCVIVHLPNAKHSKLTEPFRPSLPEVGITEIVPKTQQNHRKPRILIVDDEPDILILLNLQLSDDYSLEFASDGGEALACLQTELPDLIIVDLVMPHTNGLSLVQQLKVREKTRFIPIIMMSADVREQAKIQGLSQGVDVFMEKPFDYEVLRAQIKSLIEKDYERHREERLKLLEAASQNDSSSVDAGFEKALQALLENNFATPEFGVSEISEHFSISHRALQKRVAKLHGVSPIQLLYGYRCEKAKTMIDKGRSMEEIASVCGFTSAKQLTRWFKRVYGYTPSQMAVR